MKELEVVRSLRPIREWYPWLVPGTVALGVLAALFEGVGLSLFMPFLYSLEGASFSPPEDSVLAKALYRLFAGLPPSRRLLVVSLGIMSLVLLKNLLVYAKSLMNGWIRTMLVHTVRSRLADQLLKVRIDFIEGMDAGKLVNALQQQTQETGEAFTSWVELLTRVLTALVFTSFLVLVSWRLTAVVGIALLAISFLVRLAWRGVETRSHEFVRAWDRLSQRCLELVTGARTIRVFDSVESEGRRFDAASHGASRVWFQLDVLSGLVRPASEVMVVGVLVAVLLTTLNDAGKLPVVLTFAFIFYRLRPHVQGIDVARARLLGAKAPVETVIGFLDSSDKPYLAVGEHPFRGLERGIRFQNVSFRHSGGDRDALHDVTLRIPAGRTTAVLGRSGAGKSTLLDLVLRLYDPTEGTVLVDGVPLDEIDLHAWRQRVAIVAQHAMLFNTSVRDNVAYGRPGASPDQIRRALRLAGAEDYVNALPGGLDSVIGEQGLRISGGEKQRIALARALVREPDVLVLDEATSALDAEIEQHVVRSVRWLGDRVTTIVVSHRFSAVAHADHFILLENGRVLGEGNLETILALGSNVRGLYGTDGHEPFTLLGRQQPGGG